MVIEISIRIFRNQEEVDFHPVTPPELRGLFPRDKEDRRPDLSFMSMRGGAGRSPRRGCPRELLTRLGEGPITRAPRPSPFIAR